MAELADGLVLCMVGDHRLAFPAREVTGIDVWASALAGMPYARTAWQLPPAPGRLVVRENAAVVVDTLEISSDPVSTLEVPPSLRHAAGGALEAFVLYRGQLWPLVQLAAFARYLEAQPS